jgi:hypothetical protein
VLDPHPTSRRARVPSGGAPRHGADRRNVETQYRNKTREQIAEAQKLAREWKPGKLPPAVKREAEEDWGKH